MFPEEMNAGSLEIISQISARANRLERSCIKACNSLAFCCCCNYYFTWQDRPSNRFIN